MAGTKLYTDQQVVYGPLNGAFNDLESLERSRQEQQYARKSSLDVEDIAHQESRRHRSVIHGGFKDQGLSYYDQSIGGV